MPFSSGVCCNLYQTLLFLLFPQDVLPRGYYLPHQRSCRSQVQEKWLKARSDWLWRFPPLPGLIYVKYLALGVCWGIACPTCPSGRRQNAGVLALTQWLWDGLQIVWLKGTASVDPKSISYGWDFWNKDYCPIYDHSTVLCGNSLVGRTNGRLKWKEPIYCL